MVLRESSEIDRYLNALGYLDQETWGGEDQPALERLLSLHYFDIVPSRCDGLSGKGFSLRHFLSILKDPERRGRVFRLALRPCVLGRREQEMLLETRQAVSCSGELSSLGPGSN